MASADAIASASAVSEYAFASTSAWSALSVASVAAADARTTSLASADAIASASAWSALVVASALDVATDESILFLIVLPIVPSIVPSPTNVVSLWSV